MHILFTLTEMDLTESIVKAPSPNCIKIKHISKHLENTYHMYLGYVYADALVRADTHVVMETHMEYSDWRLMAMQEHSLS